MLSFVVFNLLTFTIDIEARGEDDATPLHYAARFRPVPRIYGGTPRPTPSPSMENINDNGLTLKKDDKKKEGVLSSFGKGTKLLGSLNNKREKLGNKLFPKDFLTVERRTSIPKEPIGAPSVIVETMIMYLLSQKAKVNVQDRYGSTPLHYAVAKGNPDAVKELLTDPGIDIEVRTYSHVHIKFICIMLNTIISY